MLPDAAFWQLRFDGTISLGTILQIATMFLCVVGLYIKLNERLLKVETRLEPIFRWWEKRMEEVDH